MAPVKHRRWGPYVWWICPSRKCNFENKTDLSFVQGEFETKCQYCNTPIMIKLSADQLVLDSTAEEEETKPAPPTPPKQSAAAPTPQPLPASPTRATQVTPQAPSAQPVNLSPSETPLPQTPAESTVAKDSESNQKSKEIKKKAAS